MRKPLTLFALLCLPPIPDFHVTIPNPSVNCVNPGGGCDGSVPCCGQSYCVRNRCQYVPEKLGRP